MSFVVCNCCSQGFSEILSKTFSEHCSFYNEIFHSAFLYILVAIQVDIDAEEVKYKSTSNFSKKKKQFLTYSNLWQSVNFFVET